MTYREFKEAIKRLQKGRYRWLVSIAASIHQSIKYLSLILIYVNRDGLWVNRRNDAQFVSVEVNVTSYRQVIDRVQDIWCYGCPLKAGGIVVDVGAGIGEDVVAFSRIVGPTGMVFAIEAHPRLFECLVQTIEKNRLKNVIPIQVAVSATRCELLLSNEDCILSGSTVMGIGTIPVQGLPLDEIFNAFELKRIDLLKMNIEGAEVGALLGMESLSSLIGSIVVSCHDFVANRHGGSDSLRTFQKVEAVLTKMGFTTISRLDDIREEVRYIHYGSR